MRDYAKLRRDYANSWAACAALTCLFEQIGGHGQVTPLWFCHWRVMW